MIPGLDVLIGIGGDGTILRAVELAADDDVPVLGVNAGQLGYLATVEPSSLRMAIKRFLAVLEPALILGLAVLIGGIVFSILLGVMGMSELVV